MALLGVSIIRVLQQDDQALKKVLLALLAKYGGLELDWRT